MNKDTKDKIKQTTTKIARFVWDTARDLTVIAAGAIAEVATYIKDKAKRNND